MQVLKKVIFSSVKLSVIQSLINSWQRSRKHVFTIMYRIVNQTALAYALSFKHVTGTMNDKMHAVPVWNSDRSYSC